MSMVHEQTRVDRDTFVTVHDQCILDKNMGNFEVKSSFKSLTGYDFLSVMHYQKGAFYNKKKNGCNKNVSIKTNLQEYQNKIGHCNAISRKFLCMVKFFLLFYSYSLYSIILHSTFDYCF